MFSVVSFYLAENCDKTFNSIIIWDIIINKLSEQGAIYVEKEGFSFGDFLVTFVQLQQHSHMSILHRLDKLICFTK